MRLPRVRRWGRSAIVRWEEFELEACTSFWIVELWDCYLEGVRYTHKKFVNLKRLSVGHVSG